MTFVVVFCLVSSLSLVWVLRIQFKPRMHCREQLDDVRVALSDVQYTQEKLHRSDDKVERIAIPAKILALAALPEFLTREQRNTYHHLITSQFIPELKAPIPMSHLNRPKKLPPAPSQDTDQVQVRLESLMFCNLD